MKRREFIKTFSISFIGLFLFKSLLFAKKYTVKCIEAIKGGKYPGKIKKVNSNIISKEGKWLG